MSSISFREINEPFVQRLSELHGNEKYIWVTRENVSGEIERRVVLTPRFKQFAGELKNLTVHNDEVWVCSYPKCGTTWTQEMVWLLCNNLDYEGAKIDMEERFPFIDVVTIKDMPTNQNYFERVKMNRPSKFIKTHLPVAFLPDQIWTSKPKMIYISRNPKDVLVSYYHHQKMVENFQGTLDDFYRAFTLDLALFSPFHEHIADYYKLKDRDNVLFLRYEDMKLDLVGTIERTATFLNKSYSQTEIDSLADHLSFNNMKLNEATNKQHLIDYFQTMHGNPLHNYKFIRSGKVGGWRSEISPEIAKSIDEWTHKMIDDPELQDIFREN